jgi:outer membrane protein assembly factor BamE (lipoprotein component of BamABCDE complex)
MLIHVALIILCAASSSPAKAPENAPPQARWTSEEAWQKLKPGMSPEEVRVILGPPFYAYAGGTRLAWFYQFMPDPGEIPSPKSPDRGSVYFADTPPVDSAPDAKDKAPAASSQQPAGKSSSPKVRTGKPIYKLVSWQEPEWVSISWPRPREVPPPPPVEPTDTNCPGWFFQSHWDKLAFAMTDKDVADLFGKPTLDHKSPDGTRIQRFGTIPDHAQVTYVASGQGAQSTWLVTDWVEPYWFDVREQVTRDQEKAEALRIMRKNARVPLKPAPKAATK